MGISFINNTIETNANIAYNVYKPFWKVNDFGVSGGAGYYLDYAMLKRKNKR